MIRAALLAAALLVAPHIATIQPNTTTYAQISSIYKDANLQGDHHALNVIYQGDCDSSGYVVFIGNGGWAGLASSFGIAGPLLPHCNTARMYSEFTKAGVPAGSVWAHTLPIMSLPPWLNDNVNPYVRFYQTCGLPPGHGC